MNIFSESSSIKLFHFVSRSKLMSKAVVLGSSHIIWLMTGFALGYFKNLFWISATLLPWGVSLLLSTTFKRARPYQTRAFKPLMTPSVETVLLVAAVVVALCRVASGVHYVSDVIVGAVIGFSLSLATQVVAVLIALP
jgi:membrane-associated phospholipid phosphatase